MGISTRLGMPLVIVRAINPIPPTLHWGCSGAYLYSTEHHPPSYISWLSQ